MWSKSVSYSPEIWYLPLVFQLLVAADIPSLVASVLKSPLPLPHGLLPDFNTLVTLL